MHRSATARNRAAYRVAKARQTGSRSVVLLGCALVLFVAIGIAAVLVIPTGGSRAATGSEHSLGTAAAPVVVEEWSDFE